MRKDVRMMYTLYILDGAVVRLNEGGWREGNDSSRWHESRLRLQLRLATRFIAGQLHAMNHTI